RWTELLSHRKNKCACQPLPFLNKPPHALCCQNLPLLSFLFLVVRIGINIKEFSLLMQVFPLNNKKIFRIEISPKKKGHSPRKCVTSPNYACRSHEIPLLLKK